MEFIILEAFLLFCFTAFRKSFEPIYAWKTSIHLMIVVVFLSNFATLVQKYIFSSIINSFADIKNSLHSAKDFVILFDGLTIRLVGALWSLKQSFIESLKQSWSIFRWGFPFLLEISFSCMSHKLSYMIDKGRLMDVHLDRIIYACLNDIYHGFSLIKLRTTQDVFAKIQFIR